VSSTGSLTERSFYPYIVELAKRIGDELGVEVTGFSEVRIRDKFPDIKLDLKTHMETHSLIVQVKIDSEAKLLDDLVKTYPVATSRGAGLLLLLLTPEARRISPAELEKVVPRLRVRKALLLSSWASKHIDEAELESILKNVVGSMKEFERVKRPAVDYTTVALVAREAIEELAGVIRRHIVTTPKLMDQAQAIVGSFDFYKSLLSDFVKEEEVAKTYVADIMAYITVLALLFLHVASVKRFGRSVLPRIDNPLTVPRGLLDAVESRVRASQLYGEYSFIVEPFIYVLNVLKAVAEPVEYTLARYLYAVQALRPEYVSEELFGRIYQEGLPPETRKNLGAFFTNPVAARLLAYLAVERWDERVLDPACGSGTLLVSAHEAKMEKALERGLSRSEAHRLFLEEHIVGIDVMQFAKELTSINLSLQSVETPVEPRILWGDGVMKMLSAVASPGDDPPQRRSIYEWVKEDMERYLRTQLTREGFDLVIMNPPFTRRERIPSSERDKLEKALGNIVRGKVGYWAYFFASADNVIKLGGRLAAVTPEEFFFGSSAESVRRYLLKGEISKDGKWVKELPRVYVPQVIIKSAVEVAFSEGAFYRDYLVVLRKVREGEVEKYNRCVVVTLKKKLEELKGVEKTIVTQIKSLLQTPSSTIVSNNIYDAVVLDDISAFVDKHIRNLKPLVFFNSVKTLDLFHRIVTAPRLKHLDEVADLRDYTCQYTGTGFEEYCRRLFISRYESRAPKLSFEYVSEDANSIEIRVVKSNATFTVPKDACVHSLRTYAGIRHMDVTGEEEYAIIKPQVINERFLISAGLVDKTKLYRASNDIKSAYEAIAGNILLVRRARITSSNLYWLALYSSNKIIGPSSPMICLKLKNERDDYYKALTLYLNSSLALIQLLAYLAMTEGGWVTLHSDQTWSNVLVPDLESLPKDVLHDAVRIFNEVAKTEKGLTPLYSRYSSGSELQKKIDRVALKMIGLEWSDGQLDELYSAIKFELDVMQRILEESQKGRRGKRVEKPEDYGDEVEPKQRSLVEWISRKKD
jgi:predicted RNA methylase